MGRQSAHAGRPLSALGNQRPVVLAPPRVVFWAVLCGAMMMQVSYALAVPAFRGSDEFDHAYKADSVARGQLYGTVDTPQGRGQLLEISRDIQVAAQDWCRFYEYTEPDDCRAVATGSSEDTVLVSSAAAAYNPVYYAIVGLAALPFDGFTALYAMRLATMVMASALLAAAAAVTRRWSQSAWPLLALAVIATPTLIQSAAVAAPNGVGYAAACLWWATALALVRLPDRGAWWGLSFASVATLVSHSTNPMWLPLMALAIFLLRPPRWWWTRLVESRGAQWSAALVACSTVACLSWATLIGTHAEPEYGPVNATFPLDRLPANELVWVLQAIAAFPLRNNELPAIVYAVVLPILLALLATGFRAADRRVKVAMALLLAAWFVVPLTLTLMTYQTMDFSWQGRYALPLVIGLPLLAGHALDRTRPGPARPVVSAVLAVVTLAHVVCVVAVTAREGTRDLSPTFADIVPMAPVVTGMLAVSAVLVVVVPLLRVRLQEPNRPLVEAVGR